MSDSGRQIGDCVHGQVKESCPICLKSRIITLEVVIEGLRWRTEWGTEVCAVCFSTKGQLHAADCWLAEDLGETRKKK
jgi:hypothetical protein